MGRSLPIAANASASEPLLAVRNLSVRFGGVQAVQDVSFEVQSGKVTALIGPNGAGKTTIFNLVTGSVPLDEGQVLVQGQDLTGLPPHMIVRGGIARTFQDVRLFPQMSVLDNIMVGFQGVTGEDFTSALFRWRKVELAEKQNLKRVKQLMKEWGLLGIANRLASDLSYGEQKLVGIVRAMVTEPKILLLDEPLAGLNANSVEQMLISLRKLVASGKTLLVVEHNIGAVMRISDHIVVIHLGEKIAEGSPAEISRHPKVREVYLGG